MSINPWQVNSIEEFYVLKCPECCFTHKEESNFQDHAIENHKLSLVFFEKYDFATEEIGNFDKYSDSKDHLITVKEEVLKTKDDYETSDQVFLTEIDGNAIKIEKESVLGESDPINIFIRFLYSKNNYTQ